MNKKKIAIGAGIALVAIAIVTVGLKTTMGDQALGLPGEEGAENALHIQESNTHANSTAESGETGAESGESGP